VDHRADIYSLGVELYEMLTGELPSSTVVPPSRKVQMDVRLDEIVLRALDAKPELRFTTAHEFSQEIESVANKITRSPGLTSHASNPLIRSCRCYTADRVKLSSIMEQLFLWRKISQVLLDDRNLTFIRGSNVTEIPLGSIHDVSLGLLPVLVNPVGLNCISVNFLEDGTENNLVFGMYDRAFGLPSQFNDDTREWSRVLRKEVEFVRGSAPTVTPAKDLGIRDSVWNLLFLFIPIQAMILIPFFMLYLLGGTLVSFVAFIPSTLGIAASLCCMLWFRRRNNPDHVDFDKASKSDRDDSRVSVILFRLAFIGLPLGLGLGLILFFILTSPSRAVPAPTPARAIVGESFKRSDASSPVTPKSDRE